MKLIKLQTENIAVIGSYINNFKQRLEDNIKYVPMEWLDWDCRFTALSGGEDIVGKVRERWTSQTVIEWECRPSTQSDGVY